MSMGQAPTAPSLCSTTATMEVVRLDRIVKSPKMALQATAVASQTSTTATDTVIIELRNNYRTPLLSSRLCNCSKIRIFLLFANETCLEGYIS